MNPLHDRSIYWLVSVRPDGDKRYRTRCFWCGVVELHVLGKHRSTGLHFTYPMRCPTCGKYSVRYRVSEAPAKARKA